jgi:excinuclease ABC subunit C
MAIRNFKTYLRHLTEDPGVYQVLDINKKILYVGKARNLKKRVSQYFQKNLANPKTFALMQQAHHIEVIITKTETEALLLENTLIKEKKPRYNVLLKDDKSYPYLFLSKAEFPRLDFYRGSKSLEGYYFGPYPSASNVRKTLNLLQKLFKIRQCTDTFFKNRKRPCLQYYIDRCTAPCTGYVDSATYQEQSKDALLFLEGKRQRLLANLEKRMQEASKQLNYEKAAALRDQIQALKAIQEKQFVANQLGDSDVLTLLKEANTACIGILKIRDGQLLEKSEHFPKVPEGMESEEILLSFLSQYYLNKVPVVLWPKTISVNLDLASSNLATALSEKANKKIMLNQPKRGKLHSWVQWSLSNTQHALDQYLARKSSYKFQLEALKKLLDMDSSPKRIECFDISHTFGESTVASNVVFGPEGPIKPEYRRFNIKKSIASDDYGAMKEVLSRRYRKIKKAEAALPDVIIIDGGKGQLNVGIKVLKALNLSQLKIMAVAKGAGRKAGLEKICLPHQANDIKLKSDSILLHFIQRVRDEAHRFAITGHRQQREQKRSRSFLEDIPGIGPKRRHLLISKFKGLENLKQASIEDLSQLPGFNKKTAEQIYRHLHS